MWRGYRANHSLLRRLRRAAKVLFAKEPIYGMEWGDPEAAAPLRFIRDRYVLPYVSPAHTGLEIGPGGGAGPAIWLDFASPMWSIIMPN